MPIELADYRISIEPPHYFDAPDDPTEPDEEADDERHERAEESEKHRLEDGQ